MTDYNTAAGAYRLLRLRQWEFEGKLRLVSTPGNTMSPYNLVGIYVGDHFIGTEVDNWTFPSQELFAKVALAVAAGVK